MMKKLGKLPPRHDPRTLEFEKYVRPNELPPIPPSYSWATQIDDNKWGVMENDHVGDCTIAAAGHMIECWTANLGKIVVLPDNAIIDAYSAITGYDPNTRANDNGAVEIDVLNYWRITGIGGHKIKAYVALEPHNRNHVCEAVYLFGGCYVGLALPSSAKNQKVWSVPPSGPHGEGSPYSWGGHAVPVVAYDSRGLTVVTWGELKQMTWSFWDIYCEEAYAILSPDWCEQTKAPNGFDLETLEQDLNLVKG